MTLHQGQLYIVPIEKFLQLIHVTIKIKLAVDAKNTGSTPVVNN